MELLAELGETFVLGLLTPLGAVCVLPLYPGFLVYLANQLSGKQASRKTIIYFGLVISSGVILFMALLGLIFSTILEVSLTNVVGVASPIAFGILFVISLLLIFNVDVGRFLPKARVPVIKNPLASAFVFGFFFGAIVVPCNPAFIAILFTKTILVVDFLENLLRFLVFGIGLAFPLLFFAVISGTSSQAIITFLAKYRRVINFIAGIMMLGISIYYLVFVFKIFG